MVVTDLAALAPAARSPQHHIPPELLLDYAGGSLDESWSLVVACHLTLCPHCRTELAAVEQVGGSMLEGIAPQPMRSSGFAAVAGRLGEQDRAGQEAAPAGSPNARFSQGRRGGGIPKPLHDYLRTGVDRIAWRWSGAGLHSFALPVPKARGGMVSLLKIAPGTGMPIHTHSGEEMTLVLSGGFTDENGAFERGDVEIADGSIEHRPVAMAGQPCICLAVTDAPLRFKGSFGWVLNQWAKLSS